jgi:hypothetical protein
MPPKKTHGTQKTKVNINVLNLRGSVKIWDLLKGATGFTEVGRYYGKNESSILSIWSFFLIHLLGTIYPRISRVCYMYYLSSLRSGSMFCSLLLFPGLSTVPDTLKNKAREPPPPPPKKKNNPNLCNIWNNSLDGQAKGKIREFLGKHRKKGWKKRNRAWDLSNTSEKSNV